jgi:hypothetical protein
MAEGRTDIFTGGQVSPLRGPSPLMVLVAGVHSLMNDPFRLDSTRLWPQYRRHDHN